MGQDLTSYLSILHRSQDLEPNHGQPAIASVFGDDGEQAFTVFMDDSMGAAAAATGLETPLSFLHDKNFPSSYLWSFLSFRSSYELCSWISLK